MVRSGSIARAVSRRTLAILSLAQLAAVGTAQAQTPPANDPNILEGEMWTPRTQTGTLHLHGGVFVPVSSTATSATFGARLGINLTRHALLGLMGEWAFKSKSLLQPVDSGLPGFEPQIVLANVNAHLVPAMLFLQVKLTDKFPIVPYAGAAAGYEWLILQADDYRTDTSAQSVYSNWAWQGYGGVGLKLSDRTRLDGELFYNGGSLKREVTDQAGFIWTEAVDVEGIGARVGLDIVY